MPCIAGATGLIQSALARYKVAGTGVRLGQPRSAAPGTESDCTALLRIVKRL